MPKTLRNNNLPKQLIAFRSLSDGIASAVDYRLAMLAELHAHPNSAHVFSMMTSKLDLHSVSALKQGILSLRNVSRFAADILAAIPKLRTSRYQIQRAEIDDYIVLNATAFGMPDIGDDLPLISSLITSSELPSASWVLDMRDDLANPIIAISQLYESLLEPRYVRSGDTYSVQGDAPLIYNASSDSLVPISSVMGRPSDYATPQQQSVTAYTLASREDSISRWADIRLLDHVLMVFLNPEIWSIFLPASKSVDDEGQNKERIQGLKLLAAFTHSLLLIPSFFRLEIFRQGYMKTEAWLGDFPVIPADIIANYEQTVSKYDVFDIASDVSKLYVAMEDTDTSTLNTTILSFFTELTHQYGIDDLITKAENDVANSRADISITDLTVLRDPRFNYLLLSHPVGRYNLIPTLTRRVLEAEIFKRSLIEAYHSIIPLVARFLQQNYLDPIKLQNFRVPFPFIAEQAITDNFLKASISAVDGHKWSHRNRSYSFSASNERYFKYNMAYKVSLASAYVEDRGALCSMSFDAAKNIRKGYAPNWTSLMPGNMMLSDRIFETKTLNSTHDAMMRTLEYISGVHESMIERTLPSYYVHETWATMLSSFALLWLVEPGRTPFSVEPSGSATYVPVLLEGLGRPYGCTYDQLANLQTYTSMDDMIQIAPTIWISVLKRVPLPCRSIDIARFDMSVPYYYFQADTSKLVEVTEWCHSPQSLLNFTLRPLSPDPAKTLVLYDRVAAYVNESLVIETNLDSKLVSTTDDKYSLPMPISVRKWTGDMFLPFIEFRTLGGYGGSAKMAGDPDETIERLVKSMEKELITATESNPMLHTPGKDPGLSLDLPVATEPVDSPIGSSKSKRHKGKPVVTVSETFETTDESTKKS